MKTTPKELQILFFVNGPVPTEAEFAAAKALGTTMFRNARKNGKPPKDGCRVSALPTKEDPTFGCVPERYRNAKQVKFVAAPVTQQPQQQLQQQKSK